MTITFDEIVVGEREAWARVAEEWQAADLPCWGGAGCALVVAAFTLWAEHLVALRFVESIRDQGGRISEAALRGPAVTSCGSTKGLVARRAKLQNSDTGWLDHRIR